jgi:hypothetical protein
MTQEKILNKIKNLLDLSTSSNEYEAKAAALKAQELMAKYDIDSQSVVDTTSYVDEISHIFVQDDGKHSMKKWKVLLAPVIADNFRCKLYFHGNSVVFYRYKRDAEIASEVFKFLFTTGNRLAVKYYNSYKKAGKPTKGIMNAYLNGFAAGVKEDLEKQCTALMIITPKEITDKFDDMTKNWKSKSARITAAIDVDAYNTGKKEGKGVSAGRHIEG